MLEAKNVYKTYDAGLKKALTDFSLLVPEASIYGLLGPNGAGKTTFIRLINQITQPDSGSIFLNGEALKADHIKRIGYMPEERGLYKNMTVGEQLVYFGELKGMRRPEALAEAKKWFDRLHIEHWWKKKLAELSKGMAQKIQFVVTVLHRPEFLILDEPFSGFDPVNANLIKDEILQLRENGTTILLSTHRMESVEELCDRVALINNSRKVIDGPVFEVREGYKQNIYEAELELTNISDLDAFKQKYEVLTQGMMNAVTKISFKNDNANEALKELMAAGKIRNYREKIPSMNEVFIAAVQQNTQA